LSRPGGDYERNGDLSPTIALSHSPNSMAFIDLPVSAT
jgi:hypothetical protein